MSEEKYDFFHEGVPMDLTEGAKKGLVERYIFQLSGKEHSAEVLLKALMEDVARLVNGYLPLARGKNFKPSEKFFKNHYYHPMQDESGGDLTEPFAFKPTDMDE